MGVESRTEGGQAVALAGGREGAVDGGLGQGSEGGLARVRGDGRDRGWRQDVSQGPARAEKHRSASRFLLPVLSNLGRYGRAEYTGHVVSLRHSV